MLYYQAMSERRTLLVTGIVVVLIIALIIGVIWYLFNFIKARQNQPAATSDIFPRTSATIIVSSQPSQAPQGTVAPIATSVPVAAKTPTPTVIPTPISNPSNPATKIYTGSGFTITYPKTWGLLTCNNSKNFEFDPYNSTDQLNFGCNFAVKPITVIVGQTSCPGSIVTLGTTKVIKSVKTGTKGTIYRWCTQTSPMLDITHRTASTTQTGYSKDDFSAHIEEIISKSTFSPL